MKSRVFVSVLVAPRAIVYRYVRTRVVMYGFWVVFFFISSLVWGWCGQSVRSPKEMLAQQGLAHHKLGTRKTF